MEIQTHFFRTTTTALLTLFVAAFIIVLPKVVAAGTFYYTFNSNGTLAESGSEGESTSPYFWLNSGGLMPIQNGSGMTTQGSLPAFNFWRLAYASANPEDTDNGYHPQNIFRLITKTYTWQSERSQAYFKIVRDQLSASSNRNSSNGLLLFSHYTDAFNTYYAGIRVDGAAVIKKKMGGTYYTLAYEKILPGTYNHDTNPNLIPKNEWIGIRTETVNNANGTVTIRLYTDMNGTGVWTLALTAIDDGSAEIGGRVLPERGGSGIRTDFMDVLFDNFRVDTL